MTIEISTHISDMLLSSDGSSHADHRTMRLSFDRFFEWQYDCIEFFCKYDNRVPDEEENTFNTLGGFVMMRLGRIPAVADHFEWGGLRFGVMDMDERRVDKVLVAPSAAQAEADGTGLLPKT